jgi:hypothetical protein
MRSMFRAAQPFVLWILSSMLAVALVGSRPYVGIAAALMGGIATGLSGVSACQQRNGDAVEESSQSVEAE